MGTDSPDRVVVGVLHEELARRGIDGLKQRVALQEVRRKEQSRASVDVTVR